MDGSDVGSRESLVRVSSIWSIAGITVARQGVECEKKRVASLNIWVDTGPTTEQGNIGDMN
jgi:hypothetical protein